MSTHFLSVHFLWAHASREPTLLICALPVSIHFLSVHFLWAYTFCALPVSTYFLSVQAHTYYDVHFLWDSLPVCNSCDWTLPLCALPVAPLSLCALPLSTHFLSVHFLWLYTYCEYTLSVSPRFLSVHFLWLPLSLCALPVSPHFLWVYTSYEYTLPVSPHFLSMYFLWAHTSSLRTFSKSTLAVCILTCTISLALGILAHNSLPPQNFGRCCFLRPTSLVFLQCQFIHRFLPKYHWPACAVLSLEPVFFLGGTYIELLFNDSRYLQHCYW